jgi:ABC transporter substrate binding protein
MRRRDFITLASCGAAAWPLGALAQESGKIWRMGFISQGYEKFYDALFEGLREFGYAEGRNLIVERRYAEGHAERFPDFAAEMVQLKVDIIVVSTTPAALAVKKATTTIPVVFPNAISPVESGVVASLAHPGGNVTGARPRLPHSAQSAWRYSRKWCLVYRDALFSGIPQTPRSHIRGNRPKARPASWDSCFNPSRYETRRTLSPRLPRWFRTAPMHLSFCRMP